MERIALPVYGSNKQDMGQEKPVIVSRVGELMFRVKHDVNGLLVEPGNPEALAKALQTIVENH